MLLMKFGELIEVIEIGPGSWEALAPFPTKPTLVAEAWRMLELASFN